MKNRRNERRKLFKLLATTALGLGFLSNTASAQFGDIKVGPIKVGPIKINPTDPIPWPKIGNPPTKFYNGNNCLARWVYTKIELFNATPYTLNYSTRSDNGTWAKRSLGPGQSFTGWGKRYVSYPAGGYPSHNDYPAYQVSFDGSFAPGSQTITYVTPGTKTTNPSQVSGIRYRFVMRGSNAIDLVR